MKILQRHPCLELDEHTLTRPHARPSRAGLISTYEPHFMPEKADIWPDRCSACGGTLLQDGSKLRCLLCGRDRNGKR